MFFGRWERLGDIIVLPVTSFKDQDWNLIAEELWPLVALALGTQRLARQVRDVKHYLIISEEIVHDASF